MLASGFFRWPPQRPWGLLRCLQRLAAPHAAARLRQRERLAPPAKQQQCQVVQRRVAGWAEARSGSQLRSLEVASEALAFACPEMLFRGVATMARYAAF